MLASVRDPPFMHVKMIESTYYLPFSHVNDLTGALAVLISASLFSHCLRLLKNIWVCLLFYASAELIPFMGKVARARTYRKVLQSLIFLCQFYLHAPPTAILFLIRREVANRVLGVNILANLLS